LLAFAPETHTFMAQLFLTVMTYFSGFHGRWAVASALLCVSLVPACGRGDDELGGASGMGGGGAGGIVNGPTSIEFDAQSTLTMIPGEVRSVSVSAKPPGVYPVRFALLGDFKDASLDKSEIETDSSGNAEVTITAPQSATTFSVRASIGDTLSASAGVSVSASGFGTLQVFPTYDGKRKFSYWLASVRTGVTCAQLAQSPLTDGDIKGTSPADQNPQVVDVPVGPTLAVTVRGAYSVAGCQEVKNLKAGEVTPTEVAVGDLPMQLDQTDLLVTLGIDPPTTGFGSVLEPSTLFGTSPFGNTNDLDALLDAMQGSTADAAEASLFEGARQSNDWDQSLVTPLGGPSLAPKAIRMLVEPWLAEAMGSLAGDAAIRASLHSAGQNAGMASLKLDSVAGVPVAELGSLGINQVSWEADPDDTVLFGTNPALLLWPSRLLGALAKGPAKTASPTSDSVPGAIADLLSCADVAQSLYSAGSYTGCNQQCLESLCSSAVDTLWESFLNSSAESWNVAKLSVTATAAAIVDDDAAPTSFQGTWVGAISLGQASLPVGGVASGTKPPPPR
jgi:hypothetical protein